MKKLNWSFLFDCTPSQLHIAQFYRNLAQVLYRVSQLRLVGTTDPKPGLVQVSNIWPFEARGLENSTFPPCYAPPL